MSSVGLKGKRLIWGLSGGRDHRHDRVSGLNQYLGGHGTSPDQGIDLALSQLWRIFFAFEYDLCGDPFEPYSPISRGKGVRILIVGGGTGGHLFPAIALAETFMKRSADNQVRFVTTQRALDSQILGGRGFSFTALKMEGIKGKGVGRKAKLSYQLPRAFGRSLKIIGEYRPEMVLGVGGYVSGPVVLACLVEKDSLRRSRTELHPRGYQSIIG